MFDKRRVASPQLPYLPANNILQYIQLIARLLKVGGHWVNFGPLLYHFAGRCVSVCPSFLLERPNALIMLLSVLTAQEEASPPNPRHG